MEDILLVFCALSFITAVLLILYAELYFLPVVKKASNRSVSSQSLEDYSRFYGYGLSFGLLALALFVVACLVRFTRDFEVVSFANSLFFLLGMILMLYGSMAEGGPGKRSYRELSFLIVIGLSFVVASVAYHIFSQL